MKKATLISLAIAVSLLIAYLVFSNTENSGSVKTLQNIRVIAYFSKSLIEGNTISIKTKNLPSESIKNILELYGIKELKAVFTNRYNEKGFLKYHSKTIAGDSLTGWHTFSMEDRCHAAELVKLLNKEDGVYYAHIEQPLELKPCIAPNDPSYGSQWHLNYPYNPVADIRAELAWNINRGRNDVIIAVCDGGIDYMHQDLDPGDRSRVIAGYDFGSGDSDPIDNLPDNDPQSYAGHGTHVAGIIGAISNNNRQVSGVMWNCKIMPVKMVGGSTIRWPFGGTIHDFSKTALPTDVANAIDYAVNNGAHVINLSYGFSAIGFVVDEVILRMSLLYSTIASAYNRNVVVVAAMGNDYQNGNPTIYPAGFAHEVIAVGNTNSVPARSPSSSTGNHIDVSAPGSSILSTIRGGSTGTKSGTSMAAPVVSGVAGLLISQGLDRGFNLTNDDVRHILEKTADDIPPVGWDTETGYGKVNAYNALELLNTPNVLYHSVSTGGTSVKIKSFKKWMYIGPRWGLSSGVYLSVDQYQITKHITFDVPFCTVPQVWMRERESVCMSFAQPNEGYPFCQITNITTTGFDVRYAAYYVGYDINMNPVNKWIPANPASTKIAYTAVGIPNLAATAGPILGESVICSSNSTYSLQNLPADCTLSWEKSSNLSYVSGQNTNNYVVEANGNGEGWVKATVNSGCGNVTLPQKTIWVGVPEQPYDISGFPYNGMQFPSSSYFNFIVWTQPIEQGVNSYEWNVSGASILSGQGTQQVEVLTDNAINGTIGFGVSVRVGNSCGWSPWLSRTGTIYDSGGGGGSTYSIYPNPATTTVAVSVIESTNSASQGAVEIQPISSIKVFDKMGQMVLALNYPHKPRVVQLNISSLQKGIYLLKVNDAESHTLMKD